MDPFDSIDRILEEQVPNEFSDDPIPEKMGTINDFEFGLARDDLEKPSKKYKWIKEEIDYLIHYIQTIECDISGNRYANCLNHLRTEASAEVKKYFHPHHVYNSDRLKNGFNVAIKRSEK